MSEKQHQTPQHTKADCTCCGSSKRDYLKLDEDAEDAKQFGDKRWYWEEYDVTTEKYDRDMMGRLNSNLDNLLIFVSRSELPLSNWRSVIDWNHRPVCSQQSTLLSSSRR